MKKIWITGAEGHIGTALIDLLEGVEYQLLPTDINEVDITKIDEVTQFVHVNRPDVVINCAGLTDVQECENNVDEAYRVNAIGVRNVALAANEVNAKVIQISTDDVFDKESRVPYNEFDNVHPRTIYGKSKEAGEKILTQLLNRFVIIRSSWIYGIGRDFVDEVLRNVGQGKTMEVPNNQYAAPTSAKELAKVIRYFIDNEEYGLYHVVCPGSFSVLCLRSNTLVFSCASFSASLYDFLGLFHSYRSGLCIASKDQNCLPLFIRAFYVRLLCTPAWPYLWVSYGRKTDC